MASENLDCIFSLPAAADLRGKEGYPIVINTSGQVALAAAGAVAHGHLHTNIANTGEMARFVHNGKILKAKVGTGGSTVGAKASAVATGYGVSVTSGHAVAGIFLDAVAAGEFARILFLNGLANVP